MAKRTRSQVGRYSRRKGGNYENKIAKKLSEWWFDDKTILRKTPLSGGWSNKYPFDITIEKDFPFAVSGKNVEGWHIEHLMKNKKSIFIKWWDEVYSSFDRVIEWDSDYVGKVIPTLIFTKNYDNDYMMIPREYFGKIIDYKPNFGYMLWKAELDSGLMNTEFVLFLLEDFLERTDPVVVKTIWGAEYEKRK